MMKSSCPQEVKVIAAAKSGRLDSDLAAHLEECLVCQDVLLVSQWMSDFSGSEELRPPLPAPEVVWSRSRSQARCNLEKKALAPLRLFYVLSHLVILVAVVLLSLAYGPSLLSGLWRWFSHWGLVERLHSIAALPALALRGILFGALAVPGVVLLAYLFCWIADTFRSLRPHRLPQRPMG